uniref:helicase-related protein n=1 Tax=Escherichia coli TaxID=562 RepID=UPI00289F6361
LNVGLVHGRMKPAEKQAVMQSFKQGELHLLVATTVIEVGVDVPNSSLMIIENPERLGLAQLHQLRGRVGRGAIASHCVLLYKAPLSKSAQ